MLATDLAPRRENAPVRPAVRPGPARIRAPFARTAGVLLGGVAALALAPAALAHGTVVPPPPDLATFVFGWTFDPLAWLPAIVALLLWRVGVNRVNRAHPDHPVPRRRTVYWVAGVLTILFAIDSGLALYDTTLFSLHMVQHLLLTLVGPPLLLMAGPITLLLQASSPETRRRYILPVLHSRVTRALSFPVVAWVLFAGVLWASHFSPLFNLALEDPWVHRGEHLLFLTAALLFWWPVVGPDPSPWKLKPAASVLYVGLQMPQNTFLALAIYLASAPLYAHYVTNVRTWGPTVLEDQQLAGGFMWFAGDLMFISMVVLLTWVWMRAEERRNVGEDRRLEGERAAIREREVRLAARRAAEGAAAGGPGGSGPGSAPG